MTGGVEWAEASTTSVDGGVFGEGLNMRSESASRLRMLLKLEFFLTLLPAILFSTSLIVLLKVFPLAAIVVLTVAFIYLLPAFAIVNGLGYKTVHGSPPLPIPADSLDGLLLLIAAHAAFVAGLYLSYLGCAAASRWWKGVNDRAWEALTKAFGKNGDPVDKK